MKNLKSMLGFLGAGVLLVGNIALRNIAEEYETGCEIYQGYHSFQGEKILVFDEKDIYGRRGKPNYTLVGNPYTLAGDPLEIGKEYKLKAEDPKLGRDRLLSATPCEDTE